RFRIGSAPSRRITPAAILVVVLSSGPYRATVPRGYCSCRRPDSRPRSSSTPLPKQQCLYFLPLPQGQGRLREILLRATGTSPPSRRSLDRLHQRPRRAPVQNPPTSGPQRNASS